MIKFVHSYLDKYYRLDTITLDGDASICKKTEDDTNIIVYPKTLVAEIITIFSVEEDIVTLWICEWANEIKFNVDLGEWWKREEWTLGFPIINQVRATTLANEIVSVQPMSAPTGKLNYMDYICGTDPAIEDNEVTIISYLGKISKLIKNKFGKAK